MSLWFVSLRQRNEQKQTLFEGEKALKSPHKGRFGEGKMSLWFVSLRQRNEQKQTKTKK